MKLYTIPMALFMLFTCISVSAESPAQPEADYYASLASQNPGIFQNQTILISGREGYTGSESDITYKSKETAFMIFFLWIMPYRDTTTRSGHKFHFRRINPRGSRYHLDFHFNGTISAAIPG